MSWFWVWHETRVQFHSFWIWISNFPNTVLNKLLFLSPLSLPFSVWFSDWACYGSQITNSVTSFSKYKLIYVRFRMKYSFWKEQVEKMLECHIRCLDSYVACNCSSMTKFTDIPNIRMCTILLASLTSLCFYVSLSFFPLQLSVSPYCTSVI